MYIINLFKIISFLCFYRFCFIVFSRSTYRRQGIGEKLVQIGLKLVESKWKDDSVFVAVDMINKPAISMYKKFNFEVVIFTINPPEFYLFVYI